MRGRVTQEPPPDQNVETYNVYDDLGNLRFIIPPQALREYYSYLAIPDSVARMKSKWVTEYHYDTYNRQIEKLSPEEDVVTTVYDRLNRVVMRQDGKMRPNKEWFFTKYDKYGRTIMSGIYKDETHISRQQMQDFVYTMNNNTGFCYETRAQGDVGYTINSGFGVDIAKIWTLMYYDDYDFDYDGSSPDIGWAFITESEFSAIDHGDDSNYPDYWVTGHSKFDRIKDKPTKTRVRNLGVLQVVFGNGSYTACPPGDSVYIRGTVVTLLPGFQTATGQLVSIGEHVGQAQSLWVETVDYYDAYGRVIQAQTRNQLGGLDVASTQYDFSGKVLRTKFTHMKYNQPYPTVTVNQRFVYDTTGRLLKTYQKNNSDSEIIVSKLEYNELGQVKTKKLYTTDADPIPLQKLDYTYNARGWIESVNNPHDLTDQDAHSNDLFGYKLLYNVPESGMNFIPSLGSTTYNPQFNGNVSGVVWASQNDGVKGYAFDYDNMNRLKGAWYGTYSGSWASSNTYGEKNITYDLNGNLKSMYHTSSTQSVIDNLSYYYSTAKGNSLDRVADAAPSTGGFDFVDGIDLPNGGEYLYDANGNMIEDKNKGVTVSYNYMNLPTTVHKGEQTIEFTYSASGTKLSMTTSDGQGENIVVRDYVGGFEYIENGSPALQQFPMSEGRMMTVGTGTFDYEYYLKDHLGNVRLIFKKGSSGGQPYAQRTQEDFYYPFGLRQSLFVSGTGNKYLYNSKELIDAANLNWYDYGARFYDPQLGRWHAMDRADELNSPYSYVHNNPLKYIDPDGSISTKVINGRMYIYVMSAPEFNIYTIGLAISSFLKWGFLFNEEGLREFTDDNIFNRGDYLGSALTGALVDKGVGLNHDAFGILNSVGGAYSTISRGTMLDLLLTTDQRFFSSPDILNYKTLDGTQIFVSKDFSIESDLKYNPTLWGEVGDFKIQINPDYYKQVFEQFNEDEAKAQEYILEQIAIMEKPTFKQVYIEDQQFRYNALLYNYTGVNPYDIPED